MIKHWKSSKGCYVYRILSGRANVYMIISAHAYYLIDTGRSNVREKLIKNFKTLNNDKKLSALILTHTHYDHCQNAAAIKQMEGCRVIVSSAAEESIRQGYTELPAGTTLLTDLIVRMGRNTGWKRFRYEAIHADQLVDEELNMEDSMAKIRIISTPGHSADSLSVIVDNEIAIVGDALFGISRRSVMPPFANDRALMVKSWHKLLETGCNIFLPGHGSEVDRILLEYSYNRYKNKF